VRRLPRGALLCAVVAFANALVWSFVTPPFHVPDEGGHIAFVQYLAEKGGIPDNTGAATFSLEESALYDQLHFNGVVGANRDRTVWSELQQRGVDAITRRPPSSVGGGGPVGNSGQPPLYYALEAGVYLVSPWQNLLDRIALMRVLSCLMAALTVLMVFLFLRELFVEPWTWTVGALAVAFQPLFGFISSGVNPDALLFTASAALFFTLARAFNRGLTPRRGAAIGACLALGALAKLNFLAIVPGGLLGLALLLWRNRSAGRRAAVRGVAAATGVLAAAVAAVVALNLFVWDRGVWGADVGAAATSAAGGTGPGAPALTLREQISYTWQLYLPRLPFMTKQFPTFQPWDTWFKGTIGTFGWLDTQFAGWVYKLALAVVLPLVALCAAGVARLRGALRSRLAELVTYTAIAVGVLLSIGVLGLRQRVDTGMGFAQARYLLPLASLYAAALVLAARGAGRRFQRPVAAVIVVLAMAQNLFAMLLVVSRYYG
jgi:hypothetical protein